jgi:alkanesulfonate monooxygenase SsuD/methylene tetrahydromethanopterin reductase-like flavin-dependent oxidoreductase (luciferase family)
MDMWLNKIKQAMAIVGLKTVDIKVRASVAPIVAEDEAAIRQRERVNQAFIKQQNNLNTTALVPHAADCEDNWTCRRSPCFKWEPDKIVGKPFAMYGQQDSLKKIQRLNEEIEKQWRRNLHR